ncbi:M15 family metallopeptidase [Gracilibacillus sp. YIM 98692]|uniref:M15 family metallopeptidase n=1 Tax=Gracilibacillus sp. YIM 98692 TaxID=2663532 RepID=UPI0013D43103|nr:M15 family metallopeptidase [Gracilibacillus sp. YIM 98692]
MKIRAILSIIIILTVILFVIYQYMLYQKYASRPMPTALHSKVEEASQQLITKAEETGITVVITDGFRSVDEQNSIYAQGRQTEGNIVTYARGGESYHNYGLAIDFALQNKQGGIIWDLQYDGNENGNSDWMEVVKIAKSLGFKWGGDFTRFKDYPHLQMDFGLSIHELKRGKRPRDVIDL